MHEELLGSHLTDLVHELISLLHGDRAEAEVGPGESQASARPLGSLSAALPTPPPRGSERILKGGDREVTEGTRGLSDKCREGTLKP